MHFDLAVLGLRNLTRDSPRALATSAPAIQLPVNRRVSSCKNIARKRWPSTSLPVSERL